MRFEAGEYEDQIFSDDAVEGELAGAGVSALRVSGRLLRCQLRATGRTIRGCTFEKCVFIGCSFKNLTLVNCSFNVCVFKWADFFRTLFRDCRLMGCEVLGARCTGMSVQGGDWSYANLANLKFSRQTLHGVRLRETALSGCSFSECDLTDCDLTRATVHGASFRACDLRGSVLDGVAVTEASWAGSKIDLAQCIVIAQEATGAVFEEPLG